MLLFTVKYRRIHRSGQNSAADRKVTQQGCVAPELKSSLFKLIYAGADPWRGGGSTPAKIGKNMTFWRKIVIFHTKNPPKIRATLRSVQFF